MKFFIEKKLSKSKGVKYVGLYADLGYKTLCICLDSAIIVELLDMRFSDLGNIDLDTRVYVGELSLGG